VPKGHSNQHWVPHRAFCLFVLLALTAGCGRSTLAKTPAPRLAVLRCENLSGDASLDWMGRALSEILSVELSWTTGAQPIPLSRLRTAGNSMGPRPTLAPGISAERQSALALGATRIVTCEVSATRNVLRLAVQVEDATSLRTVERAQAQGTLAGGVFPLAASAVSQLGGAARRFGTEKQDAVRAYAEGLDAPDAAAAAGAEARAVAADPNFGPAYLAWLEMEVARRDLAGANRVLELAQARGDAIGAYERARLALAAAELHNDRAGRVRALSALAKIGPADPLVYRGLADAALQGRRYRDAVNAYEKALALAPGDVALLNGLGYAEAYLGDLQRALEALRKYERLQPAQANPIDSQADVNFYFGRYAEAEKLYLSAHEKAPNFLGGIELLKAAQARLATGDIPAADAIFQRYAGVLDARHDASAEYRKAQWKYLTGRRREAVAMLNREAAQSPQFAVQIVLWELQLADRPAADRAAKAIAALQGAPPVLLGLATFLTEAQAPPAEWQARAGRLFAQPSVQDQMIAYRLLFDRQFREALPFLRRAYEQSNPATEEGLPVLLAWAMMECGQWDGITSLVGPTPLPQAAGPGPFTSLYFPRLFYLRARNFERLGKKDQALENYRLFLKLSGSDAEMWGDEQRAREAVGR
jgi:tetratricopeptide (TPR) repeat protein